MAKAKRDKEGIMLKFKAMDSLSKRFVVGFVIAGVVMTGFSVNYIYRSTQAHLREVEYEDPSVNFMVVPPKGWTATVPSRFDTEKIISETTNGGIFDVTRYALKEEIVPVVLVEDVASSKDSGVSGSSYISIALRGFDSSKDRTYDLTYCKDYLGVLLDKLGSKEIKYTKAEKLEKGNFNGSLVQAEAKDSGVKVYYTQYQEVIGSNVLTLTFGTTKSDMDGTDYINETLKHLKFKILSEKEFMSDILNTSLKENTKDSDGEKESKDDDTKDSSKDIDNSQKDSKDKDKENTNKDDKSK